MSHSVILEDFTPGLGHPGASIIPAAFAIAEEKNSSGSELITAIVAGYDTLRGVGSGLGNRLYSGFGESSVLGGFGSVAAVCKLLNLNEDQIASALGYAATFASGTLEHWMSGSMEGMFQIGVASRNGVFLAKLVGLGAIAAETSLDGPYGFYKAFTGSPGGCDQPTTSYSNSKFAIMDTLIKRYPSCGANQAAIDLGVSLSECYHFKADDILKIIQKISPMFLSAPGNTYLGPFRNQFQAQMSTQFCLAAALMGKPMISPDFYVHHYDDAEIFKVARKVDLVIEEGRDWFSPRIEVILKNGQQYIGEENRLTKFIPNWEMAVKSFTLNAENSIGEDKTAKVIETVTNLDKLGSIGVLTALLHK
jgi:2-methylcitrate dehydratase PrpD